MKALLNFFGCDSKDSAQISRIICVGAAAIVLALSLTGCGGGSGPVAPVDNTVRNAEGSTGNTSGTSNTTINTYKTNINTALVEANAAATNPWR